MELMTLDSSFQPNELVENYNSLLWTERYSDHDDFELKSNDIPAMIKKMPLETCVALRESNVPMVVETYNIRKPPNAIPEITITGRSFETVLERRVSVNSLPTSGIRPEWTITANSASDAAYKAIRTVIGDFPRYDASAVQVLPLINPLVPEDAIPEIDLVLPADYSTLTPNTYEIKAGNLYETVMELIQTNHHGMRSVRPLPGSEKVRVEIHNGANLTGAGDNSDPDHIVIFDARFDQFDDSTYLFSEQNSGNMAYVYGNSGSEIIKKTLTVPSGLDRRVILVDENENLSSAARNSRGLVALYQQNVTALFDGEISVQVADGFNRDYFLGDIVRLVGEYADIYQNVRVAEFIRSSDPSGDKSYPTFEAVENV